MSHLPDFRDYRDQIRRLRDLTVEARLIAVQAIDEGYNAKSVRANLYSAIKYLNNATISVADDLIDADPTTISADRQYERDLS